MSYSFLPDKKKEEQPAPAPAPKPVKTNSGSGAGSQLVFDSVDSKAKLYFFDQFKNHFDIAKLYNPVNLSDFNLSSNFENFKRFFRKQNIEDYIKDEWYGQGTQYEKLVAGYTEFSNPDLLHKVIEQVKNILPNNLISQVPKPTININDRFGLFSFDLASNSMFYVYDYFDKNNVLVDANFVIQKDGIFIDTLTNEEVYQKIKIDENGNPKVISTAKKCLIDFSKKNKDRKAVELFCLCTCSANEKAEDYIYNSMACIAIAKDLILKGFKVKITAVFCYENDINTARIFELVPVKNYNETLDINSVAYVCSDARYYRYQHFKAVYYCFDQSKLQVPSGLGYPIKDLPAISKQIEKYYVPNSREKADTRLYFGTSRSLEAVSKEVRTTTEILNTKYGADDK